MIHFHSVLVQIHNSLHSLLAESPGDLSLNVGYNFGQICETYSISAAHGSFQYASFNNSRSFHFFLAAWPVIVMHGINPRNFPPNLA